MTTLKTPQDFLKMTTDFYASVPKTPEDAKVVFEKVQTVFKTEFQNSQDMWKTYQKAAKGDATVNEIAAANKQATELLKTTAFGALIAMPGSLFVLPVIIEKAKEYNIDLVPQSVATQFNI
jgi:hypothetical protein